MMLSRTFIAAAVAGALLAGCGGGSSGIALFGGTRAAVVDTGAAQAGTPLALTQVARDGVSGIAAPRQVVIGDQAAWAALWAEHAGSRNPAPALPAVDFTRQILVAVFAGERPNACHATSVLNVKAQAARLLVEFEERVSPAAQCVPVAAQPMQVVAIERSAQADTPAVEFVKVRGQDIAPRPLASSLGSRIDTPRQVVVKDAAAWAALWAEHAGGDVPLPAVDFSREFVIGVFRGAQSSGCYATDIERVIRLEDRLLVRQVDIDPGPAANCVMMLVSPARLVAVARAEAGADTPVEFVKETRLLQ